MTTCLEIVTRAFRKIAVSGQGATITATMEQEGVDALNMMLSAWKLAGVDVSHYPLDGPDTFPLDPEFEEGTVYNLASRLAPDYMTPPAFDADDWFRKIQAAYAVVPNATVPSTLLRLGARRSYPSRY